ncbi:MAG: purine-nucleoside phosphorylase [Atopostipes suicloacalis]|nr:purine-nucleoside phosphorylase [Atopostipes suicloacalis]
MLVNKIKETKDFIQSRTDTVPEIGIILGSGLGPLADQIEQAISIPYSEIPNFAKSEAVGHDNDLVIGEFSGKKVVAMKGRFHYYEGFSAKEVTFPVHVMKALGVEKLIITNACGAINTDFEPGELMLIDDHINTTATTPFHGPNDDDLGPRFTDLTNVYSKDLQALAYEAAEENNLSLQKGVYAWWTGPAYETPAEIRMLRMMGADAVGMSTVPEAIVAAYSGLDTLGISCLTNMAAGILDEPLSHDSVIQVAAEVHDKFVRLVTDVIAKM